MWSRICKVLWHSLSYCRYIWVLGSLVDLVGWLDLPHGQLVSRYVKSQSSQSNNYLDAALQISQAVSTHLTQLVLPPIVNLQTNLNP